MIYIQAGVKSNQEISNNQNVSHIANYRYGDKNQSQNSKASSTKLGSREDSLINYELLAMSHSKNFIGDRRKRGKSSFYKKIADISNNS